jgi:AraC-like DNA-binding protein
MLETARFLRNRSEMKGDPLSDILALSNARCVISGSLAAGGEWALCFPPPGMIKFVAIAKGACWLLLEGETVSRRLDTGDVIMLPPDRSFRLASDVSLPAADGVRVFAEAVDNVVTVGDGRAFFAVGGHIHLDSPSGTALAEILPPFLCVRGETPEATVLRWLLDQIVTEVSGDLPGWRLVADQLAQLAFVQMIRVHLATADPKPVGWIGALSDPHLAPALQLMHREPARTWQLEELARAVGMSRTRFAVRFKSATGVAPLSYLLNWRMRLAEHQLRHGREPISQVALSVGYSSESAFSNTFKRTVGMAPKRYRSILQR